MNGLPEPSNTLFRPELRWVDLGTPVDAGRSAARQRRMATLGELAGGIAHDFNNLLGVICQVAAAMRQQSDLAERERLGGLIQASVNRGAALTRKLASFGQRGATSTALLRLDEALDGLEHLVRYALPSNVRLCLDRTAAPWSIRVDPDELDLAILNLAINSRDAMPRGGTLTISTHAVTLSVAQSCALGLAMGDYAALRIADTGCGMSPATLRQSFIPHFTTKPPGLGSGLGLPQVDSFAREAGGMVEACSSEGLGTIITLYLPRMPSPAA